MFDIILFYTAPKENNTNEILTKIDTFDRTKSPLPQIELWLFVNNFCDPTCIFVMHIYFYTLNIYPTLPRLEYSLCLWQKLGPYLECLVSNFN